MPNLKDTLKDTFTFTSNPSAIELDKNKSLTAKGKQWLFSQNSSDSEITDLICKSEDMDMVVCTSIKWSDLNIKIKNKSFELKMTSDFLLKKYYSASGKIKDNATDLWVLPAEVDPCLCLVYGFQFDYRLQKFVPIKENHLDNDNLMPATAAKPPHIQRFKLAQNQIHKIKVSPFRIIVCLEFATCQKKVDFEPAGLLDAARFSPYVLIRANDEVDSFDMEIEINRPAKVGHQMEGMNTKIKPKFFSDNNNFPAWNVNFHDIATTQEPLFPYWDAIFDHYDLDPVKGEYVVVDPTNKSKPPKSVKAIKYITSSDGQHYTKAVEPPVYENRRIKAYGGQGLFDNVHLAPTMIAEKEIRSKRKGYDLEDIKMAPVCVHDCMHMHWRWGAWIGRAGKTFRGFNRFGKPNSEDGAPMVPLNQKITIALKNSHSIIYKVSAVGNIGANKWHVIMHHGLAYAVTIANPVKLAKIRDVCTQWTDDVEPEINRTSWPMFYWNLRFVSGEKTIGGKRAFYPRLLIEK